MKRCHSCGDELNSAKIHVTCTEGRIKERITGLECSCGHINGSPLERRNDFWRWSRFIVLPLSWIGLAVLVREAIDGDLVPNVARLVVFAYLGWVIWTLYISENGLEVICVHGVIGGDQDSCPHCKPLFDLLRQQRREANGLPDQVRDAGNSSW